MLGEADAYRIKSHVAALLLPFGARYADVSHSPRAHGKGRAKVW